MNVKGAALSNPWFWVRFLALALSAGCAEKAAVVPKEAAPPAPEIAPMGFSIQVGAFTDLHKAARLTRSSKVRQSRLLRPARLRILQSSLW
jgi:hypothetical protein